MFYLTLDDKVFGVNITRWVNSLETRASTLALALLLLYLVRRGQRTREFSVNGTLLTYPCIGPVCIGSPSCCSLCFVLGVFPLVSSAGVMHVHFIMVTPTMASFIYANHSR